MGDGHCRGAEEVEVAVVCRQIGCAVVGGRNGMGGKAKCGDATARDVSSGPRTRNALVAAREWSLSANLVATNSLPALQRGSWCLNINQICPSSGMAVLMGIDVDGAGVFGGIARTSGS